MLEELLIGLGGKALAKIVAKKFGAEWADLATEAIEALGRVFGVEPTEEAVTGAITRQEEADPAVAAAKVVRVEAEIAPRLLAYAEVIKAGNEQQRQTNELLLSAAKEPGWRSDWLYAWQWFLMFMWAWSVLLVHVVNAAGRLGGMATVLPAPDLGVLMTLTGCYLGLHMGGHTVLELMRNRFGGIFGRDGSAK